MGTYRPLFHHQIATCTENVKFREVNIDLLPEVKDSIYFPELKIMIYHLQIDQF